MLFRSINGSEVSASVTTPDIAPSVSLRNDLLFAKRFDDRLIEAKRNKKENIDLGMEKNFAGAKYFSLILSMFRKG